MRYYQLLPRNLRLIGLETFVFVTFLAICAILDRLVRFVQSYYGSSLYILYSILSVIFGLFLILLWLFLWYLFTKTLMKTSSEKEVRSSP